MQRLKKFLVWSLLTLGGLSLAVVIRIETWGNPVPSQYRLTAIVPGNPGGDRSWTYVRASDGSTLIASDTDGDGTIDTVLQEGDRPTGFNRPRSDDTDTHWLIVCLDGVPYEEMAAIWEEGHFREFFRPVPLIAPFPSESEVALTESVHAGPVPGYEHKYFDRTANQVRGGLLTTFRETDIPYLRIFDYDMGGIFKGVAYLLPDRSYRADLGRMSNRFLKSEKTVYLAHIASADSLYHIKTKEQMRELIKEAGVVLRNLYLGAEGKLRITVYGDHGNSLVASHAVDLKGHLAGNGWRLRTRLDEPNDVVVPAYGLIGFSAVYVQAGRAMELGPVLAGLEGVDLVVRPAGRSVEVYAGDERATVEWRDEGAEYRYVATSGDPLELKGAFARLRRAGKLDTDGWVSDAELFAATMDHKYPDAARRLQMIATNHVKNRADLMISYAPGYFYGAAAFQPIVDILSTHGSLDRAQSLGFAMSTDGPLPRTIRSGELLPKRVADRKR